MRAPTMDRRCPYCGLNLPPNIGFRRHLHESAACREKAEKRAASLAGPQETRTR
jgi:hypothetical protein